MKIDKRGGKSESDRRRREKEEWVKETKVAKIEEIRKKG